MAKPVHQARYAIQVPVWPSVILAGNFTRPVQLTALASTVTRRFQPQAGQTGQTIHRHQAVTAHARHARMGFAAMQHQAAIPAVSAVCRPDTRPVAARITARSMLHPVIAVPVAVVRVLVRGLI